MPLAFTLQGVTTTGFTVAVTALDAGAAAADTYSFVIVKNGAIVGTYTYVWNPSVGTLTVPFSSLTPNTFTLTTVDTFNVSIQDMTASGAMTYSTGHTSVVDYNVTDSGAGAVFTLRSTCVVVDPTTGNAYISEIFGGIKLLTPAGAVSAFVGTYNATTFADGTGTNAYFNNAMGMVLDGKGNIYVCDRGNNRIRKVVMSTGVVTTFAGNGTATSVNGTGTNATFFWPIGIAIDPTGTYLYVTEQQGSYVRRIEIATAIVTTLAGNGSVTASTDGTGTNAAFQGLQGLTIDPTGTILYVCDLGGNKIRKIVISTGVVTTFAGSGASSNNNGIGTNASFDQPVALTMDASGTTLYVGLFGGCQVRKITIATAAVTTIAGVDQSQSYANGLASSGTVRFGWIQGIFMDSTGVLWIADYYPNNRVRKMTQLVTSGDFLTYSFSPPMSCFTADSKLLTPTGYKTADTIHTGDILMTADGRKVPVKAYHATVIGTKATAPFLIPKDALALGCPKADLRLSPWHAIQMKSGLWMKPQSFSELYPGSVQQYDIGKQVTYYHFEAPNFFKDNLICDGTIVESYGADQLDNVKGRVYNYNPALKGYTRITGKPAQKALMM